MTEPVPGGQVHAGPAAVPLIPLILAGAGVYLCWFAVHYWGSDTRWPTDPVKAVLQGKPLPVAEGQQSAQDVAASVSGSEAVGAAAEGPAGTAPAHSGAYDLQALQQLWMDEGGSSQTAFEAANVAIAESSGNPDATSANPDGGTNVGLWQLDTRGVGAGYTEDQLKDPGTNARITVLHTANGTNWSSWADPVVKGGIYVGPAV
jgi:Lysozyme like domain